MRTYNKQSLVKRALVLCLLAALLLAITSCGQKSDPIAKTGLGTFSATDMNNNKITESLFQENALTLVNVFSSTCNPCMGELPHLAELATEYKSKKVGILALNIDTDSEGNIDEASKEAVLKVLGDNNKDMKVAFWGKSLMQTLSAKTDALPYSFFVDKNGKIVGEELLGAYSKQEWAEMLDKQLAALQK